MYIRVQGGSTVIGNTYCCTGITEKIDNKYEDKAKEKINDGLSIKIYSNGKWVDGKQYFSLKKIKKENKIKQKKEEVKDEIDYFDLFDGHWQTQVKKIKEFTDNIEELNKLLDYAKGNDVSDGVIERIEEYIEELE